MRFDLTGDGNDWNAVQPRVGDTGDQVRRARTARGHTHTDPARRASVSLRRERATLLVSRQDGAQAILETC